MALAVPREHGHRFCRDAIVGLSIDLRPWPSRDFCRPGAGQTSNGSARASRAFAQAFGTWSFPCLSLRDPFVRTSLMRPARAPVHAQAAAIFSSVAKVWIALLV